MNQIRKDQKYFYQQEQVIVLRVQKNIWMPNTVVFKFLKDGSIQEVLLRSFRRDAQPYAS